VEALATAASGLVPPEGLGDGAGTPDLVGRERERRVIDAFLLATRQRSAALVVSGEPGMGKSTLLGYAAGESDARVLRVRGIESEATLPYSTLADLLLPLHGHLESVPETQRAQLEVCLALAPATATGPLAVCTGALNLLAAASAAHPLLVLVDDLQWVDPQSRRVLLFAAHRLSWERVGLLLALAEEQQRLVDGYDLPQLEVAGMNRAESEELLARHGHRMAPGALHDLVVLTGGNPLALLECAGSCPSSSVRKAWIRRLSSLSEPTGEALVVLAASLGASLATVERALANAGLSLAELAPAESLGLVVTTGDRVELKHPLLRRIVLDGATLDVRLRAFRALAEAAPDELSVWYRAAAAMAPDEVVARQLESTAQQAQQRSGYAASAVVWGRSAELSGQPVSQVRRYLRAAVAAHLGGLSHDALAWCERAWPIAQDDLLRADLELVRGRALTWVGHPARAHEQLVAAAHEVREKDPERAGALLAEAALPALLAGRVGAARAAAEQALSLGADGAASVALGHALVLAGDVPDGRPRLAEHRARPSGADQVGDQQTLTLLGQGLTWTGDFDQARSVLSRVIDAARAAAAPAALPYALAARSDVDRWTGHWATAYADATEALRWAEELHQVGSLAYSLGCLARLDALRGDRASCEARIRRVRREAGPYGIGAAEIHDTGILGLAALGCGDYESAAQHLADCLALVQAHGLGNPLAAPFAPDLADASARAGLRAQAEEALDWLESAADRTGLPLARAAAARTRGMLARRVAEAESCFDEAAEHHKSFHAPFEQACTSLHRGEVLRRLRRPAAARAPLQAALTAFELLGARPWASRAAGELAATGVRAAPRGVGEHALTQLTAQELQVARAVAGGMSNNEAAASLFVSRKTVEAHLTAIYRKLGLRSRSELTRTFWTLGVDE